MPVHCTRHTSSSPCNSRRGMERSQGCQKNSNTVKHVPQCLHSWNLANTACKRLSCSAVPTKDRSQQQQQSPWCLQSEESLPAASGLLPVYKGAFLPTLRFPGGTGISCQVLTHTWWVPLPPRQAKPGDFSWRATIWLPGLSLHQGMKLERPVWNWTWTTHGTYLLLDKPLCCSASTTQHS